MINNNYLSDYLFEFHCETERQYRVERRTKKKKGEKKWRTKENGKKPLILSSQIRRFIFATVGKSPPLEATKMFAKQWYYMVF